MSDEPNFYRVGGPPVMCQHNEWSDRCPWCAPVLHPEDSPTPIGTVVGDEAVFEEARTMLDEADFYAIVKLLLDKKEHASAVKAAVQRETEDLRAHFKARVEDAVKAAVEKARIGWVDHATMGSQVNAAVLAEREECAKLAAPKFGAFGLSYQLNDERALIERNIRNRSLVSAEIDREKERKS